ncbi:MAG TPA: TonB C-terminal domain-containing protein [Longimicrobiales bacterium]|nr:TonB C-terminal domain-containing protein [Longimicrobiales bacterium]
MFALGTPRSTKPGLLAVIGSIVLHGTLIVGVVYSALRGPTETIEYKVYKVDLYSPPPQELGEPEAPKPQPAIVRPEPPKETAVEEKKPAPAPKPQPKKPVATGTGKSDVAKGRNPEPKTVVGGEGVDVHLEGEDFPYPEYLENIILQLNRYFRWSGAPNLEAKIGFEIMRDGSVRRIRVLQKSGNINFDLEAVSAIEQAGQRGAFGPLPKGWVNDRLPVAFSFLPPGR